MKHGKAITMLSTIVVLAGSLAMPQMVFATDSCTRTCEYTSETSTTCTGPDVCTGTTTQASLNASCLAMFQYWYGEDPTYFDHQYPNCTGGCVTCTWVMGGY